MWEVSFVRQEGQYTDDDLAAVNSRIQGKAVFDGGNRAKLVIIYSRALHPMPAHAALSVLRERYPNTKFTTGDIFTKKLFGDDVEKTRPV